MNPVTAEAAATVMVVDDDPAVRRSLGRLVRSAGYSVQTFASPTDFLRHELPEGPSCVLLDVYMDEMTGLEVQDALMRGSRRTPVVFLSGRATIPTAVAGVQRGADDFLEKPVKPDVLIKAVGRAIERDRADSADRTSRAEAKRRFDGLTPREQQVMTLVVSGLLNKQTAADLGISEKTVKVHRARVMEKMGVESLAALVLVAQSIGLAAPPANAAAAAMSETFGTDDD